MNNKVILHIFHSDPELQVQDPWRRDGAWADPPRRRPSHSNRSPCRLLRIPYGEYAKKKQIVKQAE